MSTPRTITIRATRNFYAGRRQANGARDVAIHKGETRQIVDPGLDGPFYTTTRWGTRYGLCRLGHGWVPVVVAGVAGVRGGSGAVGSNPEPPPFSLSTHPVNDDVAVDEACALYWLGDQHLPDEQDDDDSWP